MEAEIIKMTCDLFGEPNGFGIGTSGGTESIHLALLAYRNFYRKTRNITKPNM
jgi:sphinganine-1-phosphate aldolase